MASHTYIACGDYSAREINQAIRGHIDYAVGIYSPIAPGLESDFERRRTTLADGSRQTRYVFGIHTSLRSTLVAHFIPATSELLVCVPFNYPGWPKADPYMRARIVMADRIRAEQFVTLGTWVQTQDRDGIKRLCTCEAASGGYATHLLICPAYGLPVL